MTSASGIREWFHNLPAVTKYFVLFSAILPVAMKLSILPPALLVWHLPSITDRFEVHNWLLKNIFLFVDLENVHFIFYYEDKFKFSFQFILSFSILLPIGNYSFSTKISRFLVFYSNLRFIIKCI